ncbi:calcium-binding protein [Salipiger sp.]|uniref:calcium-binding protein n=1 Tax=Salipiger sp. TaxID=2078585 RepID=UPI003A9693D3
MVEMTYARSLATGRAGFGAGITDLEIAEVGGTTYLFAASGYTGGLSSYAVAANGQTTLVGQSTHASGTMAFGTADIVVTSTAGQQRVMTVLHGDGGLESVDINGNGTFDGAAQWAGVTGASVVDALSVATFGSLLIVGKRETGISVFKMERDGSVRNLRNAAVNLGYFVALEIIEEFEEDYLVGASATGDAVVSWSILADGSLIEIGRIGMEDGLGIDSPSALTSVTVNGVPYVVVAGSDSSSLSVLRIGGDGALHATDHVIDDLDSRFGGASELASAEWEGNSFVVAAGGDDGMSLFLVLEGGRLLYLDSVADTAGTPLRNVSALTATPTADGLHIYVSGEGETGIGQFDVDLRGFGDILQGTSGDDTLRGNAQDDILIGGAGQDWLIGGGGADIFVFDNSTGRDIVTDYDPAADTLDLSLIPMLYSIDQLTISATANGALVMFRDLEIEIRSADGRPLDADQLRITFGVAHLQTGTVAMRESTTGDFVTGTGGNDVLDGSSRGDEIRGLGGNDRILAGPGADTVDGGDGIDTLDFRGVDGRVLVDLLNDVQSSGFARFFGYGSALGDSYTNVERFFGGGFADNLRGGHGGDVLHGGGVSDRLYGRGGNDTLNGGTGADALYGNLGADVMTGGDDAGRRDRFIYFNAAESGVGAGHRDVITDFVPGEDRIELGRLDADLSLGGKQAFTFIGSNAFSGHAGELRAGIVAGQGITLVQADLDGDGVADFEIELTGRHTLHASDFLL